MGGGWMSAADAASALGVRVQTVYAYVSRGVLRSERVPGPDGRLVSRFDRDEVVDLARARRPARSARTADLIESDITQLDPAGGLAYRGADVGTLVGRGFEHTVRVLLGTTEPWPVVPSRKMTRPGPADPMDAIRGALLDEAAGDPERHAIDDVHCRRVGLRAVEAACGAVTGTTTQAGGIAQRLAAHWVQAAPPEVVAGVDAALCVLADHDLTASALATRAAAGVRADPWMSMLAGHAVLGGERQGAASVGAVRLLRRWRDVRSLPEDAGRPAGFGHLVYEGPDPRAVVLLPVVRSISPAVAADVESLVVDVARQHSLHPNVDIGLAALVVAAGLPDDAGTTLYGIARLAGLAAHTLEEYPHQMRLRPRSVASRPPDRG